MKKILLTLLLACLLTGCSSTTTNKNETKAIKESDYILSKGIDKTDAISEPRYSNASKRADVGFVFYESNELVGIDVPGVGVFLINYKDNKPLVSNYFEPKSTESDFMQVSITKDLKNLYFQYISIASDSSENKNPGGEKTGSFIYNIKEKKLYEGIIDEDALVKHEEKWDDNLSLENNSWEMKDLKYKPDNSDKEYFFFRDK